MPKDMLFSHGGLWVRANDAGADYQTFNLYQGDGRRLPCDRSDLVEDTPEGFFTGSVAPPEAAVLVPTAAMQDRLLALLRSPAYAALHNPDYSLMANPFEHRHQNCTDFLLRLVVAARLDITDVDRIDAVIRREFKPTEVRLNPLVRTFGSVDRRPAGARRPARGDPDGELRLARRLHARERPARRSARAHPGVRRRVLPLSRRAAHAAAADVMGGGP